jgi:hypothetical protein
MQLNGEIHPTEDELEKYLLGHTTVSRTEAIEEHLLVCGSCQAALEEAEIFVLAMRSACQELLQERAVAPRRWWQIRISVAAYAGSFAVLMTVLSLGYVYRASTPVPESELALTATRSAADQHAPFAAAGSTVLLHLDATSLPPQGRYIVELVDLAGDRIWAGGASAAGTTVTIRIGKRLEAGRYWVRLNNANDAELREFELNVH